MANKDTYIKEKYGNSGAWKVPDGYFDDFRRQVMESLPAYPEAPKKPDMTVWQRMKPYVYLAAMFAGIWLMMNVFHKLSTPQYSLDNIPDNIAQIVEGNDFGEGYFASNYINTDIMSEIRIENEVIDGYDDFSDFEKDFAK